MRHQMELKGSPIGLESRYQLWRINPRHEWLRDHQQDVQRWNRRTYYGGDGGHGDDHDDDGDDLQRYDNHHGEDADDEFEDLHLEKRRRFYENRKRLGQSEGYQEQENANDHLFDYERENRKKRNFAKNDEDKFFHFEAAQSADRFIQTEDAMKWS